MGSPPIVLTTSRAQQWAFEQVSHHDGAAPRVAAQLDACLHAIMTRPRSSSAARRGFKDRDQDRLAGVTAVGVDETSFLRATGTRHTQYANGLSDRDPTPGCPPRLLDVVPGRSGGVLGGCLARRDEARRAVIRTAWLEPFRG
jgi:hypothetical protein